MIGRFSKKPSGLGVTDGRLAPCPRSPNCVSSQADPADRVHFVEPFRFAGDAAAAWERLVSMVSSQPRTNVTVRTDQYLHAEFTTPLLRFVDDIEFLLDAAAGVIRVRSASRIGRSDLGTNRRRVERLRRAFEKRS